MFSFLKCTLAQPLLTVRVISNIKSYQSVFNAKNCLENRIIYFNTTSSSTSTQYAERDNTINEDYTNINYRLSSRLVLTEATDSRPVYNFGTFWQKIVEQNKYFARHNRFYCTKTTKRKMVS